MVNRLDRNISAQRRYRTRSPTLPYEVFSKCLTSLSLLETSIDQQSMRLPTIMMSSNWVAKLFENHLTILLHDLDNQHHQSIFVDDGVMPRPTTTTKTSSCILTKKAFVPRFRKGVNTKGQLLDFSSL